MLLSDLLKQMIDLKASDIFVVAGLPLTYKVSGRQVRMNGEMLTPQGHAHRGRGHLRDCRS